MKSVCKSSVVNSALATWAWWPQHHPWKLHERAELGGICIKSWHSYGNKRGGNRRLPWRWKSSYLPRWVAERQKWKDSLPSKSGQQGTFPKDVSGPPHMYHKCLHILFLSPACSLCFSLKKDRESKSESEQARERIPWICRTICNVLPEDSHCWYFSMSIKF